MLPMAKLLVCAAIAITLMEQRAAATSHIVDFVAMWTLMSCAEGRHHFLCVSDRAEYDLLP
jgi:hypothetical protein